MLTAFFIQLNFTNSEFWKINSVKHGSASKQKKRKKKKMPQNASVNGIIYKQEKQSAAHGVELRNRQHTAKKWNSDL